VPGEGGSSNIFPYRILTFLLLSKTKHNPFKGFESNMLGERKERKIMRAIITDKLD
jgi:hypothetical protein